MVFAVPPDGGRVESSRVAKSLGDGRAPLAPPATRLSPFVPIDPVAYDLGKAAWHDLGPTCVVHDIGGVLASYAGLLLSFHTGVPSGPAVILVAGGIYVFSLLFGHVGGLVRQALPRRHLEA